METGNGTNLSFSTGGMGDALAVAELPAVADVPLPPGLPPAHARDGESRRQTWERLRREYRAAGGHRRHSLAYATRETDRFHPHFPPMPTVEPPDDPPAPDPEPEPEPPPAAPEPAPAASDQAEDVVPGLADLPADWPPLAANASLAAEVAWVHANRLRVVQGEAVDLSRSLSPAPSHAALSWLETAIRFPSKWADVCVKAASQAQDDGAEVRRERASVAELAGLLGEMANS